MEMTETDRLRFELFEANQMLRSFAQIVARRGESTDWVSVNHRLGELLERQRVRINQWGGYEAAAATPAASAAESE